MYSELVKSLRWCADNTLCVDLSTGEQCPRFKYREICKQNKQMHEAADAIEKLEKDLKYVLDCACHLQEENEELKKEPTQY